MVADLSKRFGCGKQDQVVERANEMRDKINELAREGRVSRSRADELRALLQPLGTQYGKDED